MIVTDFQWIKNLLFLQRIHGKVISYNFKKYKTLTLVKHRKTKKFSFYFGSLHTYQKRSREADETDLSLREELTKLEKILLKTQELVEVRGKVINTLQFAV